MVSATSSSSSRGTALLALIVALVAALLYAAAWLQNFVPPSPAVGRALASDWVHVPAHVIIYGTLWILFRAALSRSSRAAAFATALTLLVGCAQEGVQCYSYRRTPGKGELFDLAVDAAACALAWALTRHFAAKKAD